MEIYTSSLFWLGLAIALGIIEAVSVQMVAIWFALGAIFAIIPALLQAPVWVQLIVFLAVSILSLVLTRPFIVKTLKQRKQATNADMIIGREAIVLVDINDLHGTGRVEVMGQDWAARSIRGHTIYKGSIVQVLSIEGVTLIVRESDILDNQE